MRRSKKKKSLLFLLTAFILFLNAYIVEAGFLKKGDVFRTLDSKRIIEVISGNGLEITIGSEIILADYSFKGNKLRIVFTVGGTKKVEYYELTGEGLKDKNGNILYSKAALSSGELRQEAFKLTEKEKRRKIIEELRRGLVLIKGGCFQMGDTFGAGDLDERPVHEVCVDDFYMSRYEVTQKLWVAFMGDNPSEFRDCDKCPVENVSWNDVQEFIRKLNDLTHQNYRLPTEAEWEYTARSRGKQEKYSGTSNEAELGEYAWHRFNSGEKTHSVGRKKPNGLGLYDMSGNVWEWVQDWYDKNSYKNSPRHNPKGPAGGTFKRLRGGGWYSFPMDVRATNRQGLLPGASDEFTGFRLAHDR